MTTFYDLNVSLKATKKKTVIHRESILFFDGLALSPYLEIARFEPRARLIDATMLKLNDARDKSAKRLKKPYRARVNGVILSISLVNELGVRLRKSYDMMNLSFNVFAQLDKVHATIRCDTHC